METVQKSFRKLEIDTAPTRLIWTEKEPPINDNRAAEDRIQDWQLTKSTSNKRYSTSSIVEPSSSTEAAELKRSTSAGTQLYFSHNVDAKGISPKKKWFHQLPRMTVKRTQSNPSNRRQADSIEPPEPPPQLLFNLSWSTENTASPSICSYSTPTSPAISRNNSGIALDRLTMTNIQPSCSSSSTSTVASEEPTTPIDPAANLLRRSSCPNYQFTDMSNLETSVTSKTKKKPLCSNSLSVRQPIDGKHKRGTSIDALSQLSSSKSSTTSSPTLYKSSTSSSSQYQYKPLFFNVYTPHTNQLVMNFAHLKLRTVKLHRRTNAKAEQKAIYHWQKELLLALSKQHLSKPKSDISPEKKSQYCLTRKFILREFYTTEINFWNQLNYTKVMYCDALKTALEKNTASGKPSDMDWFANLQDLMVFSFTLICRMRQFDDSNWMDAGDIAIHNCPIADDVQVGLVLRDLAESMVVFLRCALDYKANKKLLDQRQSNKSYAQYKEKLALRKETRQFTLRDYMIIPIQRITRYGLLLADLEKHTESTHPDYENIKIAQCIVNSLASAMNFAQK